MPLAVLVSASASARLSLFSLFCLAEPSASLVLTPSPGCRASVCHICCARCIVCLIIVPSRPILCLWFDILVETAIPIDDNAKKLRRIPLPP
jgi:hypothetical protein